MDGDLYDTSNSRDTWPPLSVRKWDDVLLAVRYTPARLTNAAVSLCKCVAYTM